MSGFVGMTRSAGSLQEAASILSDLSRILDVSMRRPGELELQNEVTVAVLLAHAAWLREESRGTHHRSDFPRRDDERWACHVTWRRGSDLRCVSRLGDGIAAGWLGMEGP